MSTARVVADQYTLIRPIGRGSSAVVYVAKARSGGTVALKMLPARPGLRPDEVDRFRREAVGLGELGHPGILPFLDAGYDGPGQSLYLAMELLHGETLRDHLGRTEPAPGRALDFLESALVPLAHAHARGQVHGDLTPSNVFWVRSREGHRLVRLLDLGLARLLTRRQLVAPGLSMGTIDRMAPEQLTAGAAVGPAADVWAFGVTLYEALTGQRPFGAPSYDAVVQQICREAYRPVEDVVPGADDGMSQLVELCLDKDPRRRPPDGMALMRLFKTIRTGFASAPRGPDGAPIATIVDPSGKAPSPPPEDLDRALRRTPRDPAIHRALLAHYDSVGAPDGVWLAACALGFLHAATKEETRLTHHYRRPRDPDPDRGLGPSSWAALLHPDQDPRIDAVWAEVYEALGRIFRRAEDEKEAQRSERLDFARPRGDLERAFRAAVGTIRPTGLPRLYRGRAGVPPRHLRTGALTSVFPKGFEEPLPAGALAFAVARHVAYYRPAHHVCTLVQEPEALEATFDAAIQLGLARGPQDADQTRRMDALHAALDPARRDALTVACARLGTSADQVDLGTWRRAVELSCMRAGVVMGSDLEGASWMLRWSRERRRIPLEDAVDDLLRFWSSGDHVRVRYLLGVALNAR